MSKLLRPIFDKIKLFPKVVKRLTNYAAPVFVTIFLFACNGSSSQSNKSKDSSHIELGDPKTISPEEMARIQSGCEAWYDTVLKMKNFNGGILVAKDGNIVFERYNGTVHIPGKDTITEHTSLQIASVSKTFTAMTVLKLQQDGKLNIDDEFNKYFPQFNYPGITIRMLLDHRSGLPNYTHFLEKMKWDKKKIATNEDVLNFLIDRKGQFEGVGTPGARFSYCNTNYALLALLIENITGKTYPAYLKETIFDPLQMKDTYVFDIKDSITAPPSYDWKDRIFPFTFLDAVYGDKNVYTTPRDLLTWDKALRSDKLFTAATLEQAYAPYSNEKPGIRNYGLGWRMNIYPSGKKMIYHNGWWHGSNAAFIRLIPEGATIIVIGNKFTRSIYGSRALANLFGDYFQIEDEEVEVQKAPDSNFIALPKKKISSKARTKKTTVLIAPKAAKKRS